MFTCQKRTESRQWRIIIAGNFSAHLARQIFRLCRSRGYVRITLGGGITFVIQTCDTDVRQAAKETYMAREAVEFLHERPDGVSVALCSQEACTDVMADCLLSMSLHFAVAKMYLEIGLFLL